MPHIGQQRRLRGRSASVATLRRVGGGRPFTYHTGTEEWYVDEHGRKRKKRHKRSVSQDPRAIDVRPLMPEFESVEHGPGRYSLRARQPSHKRGEGGQEPLQAPKRHKQRHLRPKSQPNYEYHGRDAEGGVTSRPLTGCLDV